MNLDKAQVLDNLKKVNAKIEEIKTGKNSFTFASGNLYLANFGCISDIENTTELLHIFGWLGQYEENVNLSAKEILGAPLKEVKIQDLLVSTWQNDVKNRVLQLNSKVQLKNLKAAKETLEKHLSEDQTFQLDMESVGDLIAGVEL